MKGKRVNNTAKRFIDGKGFYIVLFLCIAVIGISGYILLFSGNSSKEQTDDTTMNNVQVEDDQSLDAGSNSQDTAAQTTSQAPSVTNSSVNDNGGAADTETLSSSASALIVWPVSGELQVAYSADVLVYSETMADWRAHRGIDISAELGEKVLAASDGTVESVLEDDLMGTTVVIDHGSNVKTVYANLAETPTVKLGDTVSAGDVIGSVGSTAISEISQPPHLHFEVIKSDNWIDPLDFLPQK